MRGFGDRIQYSVFEFFRAQAPSYQRTAAFWVMDAKQEETRRRRLDSLIRMSAAGTKPWPFNSDKRKS